MSFNDHAELWETDNLNNWVLNIESTKYSNDQNNCWQNRPFTTIWPESQNSQESQKSKREQITRTIKKKTKRVRTAYSTQQLEALEKSFSRSRYIDTESRRELSECLKITEKSIKIWFQNRRMKEKRDSSECSCDSSMESLTNAISPPLSCQPDLKPEEVSTDQHPGHSEVIDTQYQFPTFNCNSYGSDYSYQAGNMPTDVSFGYDRNVYPTQYYPTNGAAYYSQEGNQYAHYDNVNYWSANTFDTGYFY